MKQVSVKKWAGIICGAVLVVAVAAVGTIMLLRVDEEQARQAALSAAGEGEIVSMEMSNEGLWNEYEYVISGTDGWYKIEVNGFGSITEMEHSSRPLN